jgi:LAGLIDADG endonuclease
MDVAFHDTYFSNYYNLDTSISIYSSDLIPVTQILSSMILPKLLTGDSLAAFVVGLIDGDGSIQVNHWRGKTLQYRIIVKLKYNSINKAMLDHIAEVYGGRITVVSVAKTGYKFVQWTVNDANVIRNSILPLFVQFPPLTIRVTLQLAFLIKALNGMSVSEYMASRNEKYSSRDSISPLFTTLPSYFGSWLVGFIEAEGSFAIRSGSLGFSFSIGQLYDRYLLQAILTFFGQGHLTVQVKKGNHPFYFIEIANIKGVEIVVEHLIKNTLQGYKYYQLAIVMMESKALLHLRHHFWII